MRTHIAMDGRALDLTDLDADLAAFYDTCVADYRAGADFTPFMNRLYSGTNPLVRAAGGWMTGDAFDHPMQQACRDLADRLGIAQGRLRASATSDPARDPFGDTWITPSEALARKGVSPMGLQKAIRRGTVIAHVAKPGGTRRLVSAASVDAWTPKPTRM